MKRLGPFGDLLESQNEIFCPCPLPPNQLLVENILDLKDVGSAVNIHTHAITDVMITCGIALLPTSCSAC